MIDARVPHDYYDQDRRISPIRKTCNMPGETCVKRGYVIERLRHRDIELSSRRNPYQH